MSVNRAFQWKCQPAAEQILVDAVSEACQANHAIEALQSAMHQCTSTRLIDWLDHVVLGRSAKLEKQLHEAGFVQESAGASYRVFYHPGAKLASIVVNDEGSAVQGVAVMVESIADYLLVRGQTGHIEGDTLGGYRRCCVAADGGVSLWTVERRGTRTMEPTWEAPDYLDRYLTVVEMWKTRPRTLDDGAEAIARAIGIAQEMAQLVGKDVAAYIVAECEREYWQRRNRAAQIQKARQDALGLGWANHDHHTFRSSRRHFASLVRLFEILGFACRERFYAGQEAGWGAQVMENPRSGLVLFLDVDLGEDEVIADFAHEPLPERHQYGTIGLWCALHGDSILQAGMHHLEAQFFFNELTQDLASQGVDMMEPFSSFTYLKQAFTKGEVWPVPPSRVERLLKDHLITAEQAEKFRSQGALGSHLENLQRREGYKGFNQKNVSFIIRKTDPRHAHTKTLSGA